MPSRQNIIRQGWKLPARPFFYKSLALSFILFGAWSLDMHLTDAWKIVLTTISAGVITFLSDVLRQWLISDPVTIKKFDDDEHEPLLDLDDNDAPNDYKNTLVQSSQHGLFTFGARSLVTSAIGARMVSAQYVRDRHTHNADWWTEGTFFGYITLVLFISGLINIIPFAIDKCTKRFTRRRPDYLKEVKAPHDYTGFIRFIWETGQFGLLISAIIYAQTYKFNHQGRYVFYKDSDALHLFKYLTAGFGISGASSLFIGLPILLTRQIPAHAFELFAETKVYIPKRSRYLFITARFFEFVTKTLTSAVIGDAILATTTTYANITVANSGEQPSEYIEGLLSTALLFTALIASWTHQHIYYLDYDIKKVPLKDDDEPELQKKPFLSAARDVSQPRLSADIRKVPEGTERSAEPMQIQSASNDNEVIPLQAAETKPKKKAPKSVTFSSTLDVLSNISIPDASKLVAQAKLIKTATNNNEANSLLNQAKALAEAIAELLNQADEADISYKDIGEKISAFTNNIDNKLPEHSLLNANANKLIQGQNDNDNNQEDPKALVGSVLNAVSDLVNASLLNARAQRLITDIGTPSQNDNNQQLLLAAKSVAEAIVNLLSQLNLTLSTSTLIQPSKQGLTAAVSNFSIHTSGNATQELNEHEQTLQDNDDKTTLIQTSQAVLNIVTATIPETSKDALSQTMIDNLNTKLTAVIDELDETNDLQSGIKQNLEQCVTDLNNNTNWRQYGKIKAQAQQALEPITSQVDKDSPLDKAITELTETFQTTQSHGPQLRLLPTWQASDFDAVKAAWQQKQ